MFTSIHSDTDSDGKCDVCGYIVDEGLANPCRNAAIIISGNASVNYGADVTIKAYGRDIPQGYSLVIFIDDKEVARGDNESVSYDFGKITSDVKYTIKIVDADGNVQKDPSGNELAKDGGTITCKDNLFMRLFAFFRAIFRNKYEVTVKPDGISLFFSAC